MSRPRREINEVVLPKGFSLERWQKLPEKTKKSIRKRKKGKATWRVVHSHATGKKGKSIYKKKPYTTLKKANARHTAIMFSKGS
ncbi:MAG: hypothetical protein AABY22_03250 [Nanoarchaeota archaeon]